MTVECQKRYIIISTACVGNWSHGHIYFATKESGITLTHEFYSPEQNRAMLLSNELGKLVGKYNRSLNRGSWLEQLKKTNENIYRQTCIKCDDAWFKVSKNPQKSIPKLALPPVRFELTTPGLRDQCSATELKRRVKGGPSKRKSCTDVPVVHQLSSVYFHWQGRLSLFVIMTLLAARHATSRSGHFIEGETVCLKI